MTDSSPAKIFTIPAGENFLDRLADGIAAMVGSDSLALSRVRSEEHTSELQSH